MKTMKKIASLLLALAMIFALATTAFAQTIEITPPTGVDATVKNTYKIYKVFDATVSGNNVAYKLVSGKTTAPAGFEVVNGYVKYSGTGTELTAEDIAAIAGYVTENDLVRTVESTGSNKATTQLDPGYYYITTSTGSVVTIDSVDGGTVTVTDKNTIPQLDKKITGANSIDENGKKALAQIGREVEYTVIITVGKGAINYVFHDKMDAGLSLVENSVRTSVNGATVNYNPGSGETFTITFPDGMTEGTKITISYKAIINESALTNDPEKNTAYVSYGDGYKTTFDSTEVYNAQFTVNKTDGANQPLEGAGFVIKNAEEKYYKYNGTDKTVTWVNSVDDATEHKSDANGSVEPFIGLANGEYTLVEKTVPAGYNKADDHKFTIAERDYSETNLKKSATVINNAGAELPSTGGMGTTLFYVLGGILVAVAVVLLVTKKRMASNN